MLGGEEFVIESSKRHHDMFPPHRGLLIACIDASRSSLGTSGMLSFILNWVTVPLGQEYKLTTKHSPPDQNKLPREARDKPQQFHVCAEVYIVWVVV